MERIRSKEDRRARYCKGLTSDHYIRTGQPIHEAVLISEERDAEIRAEIQAMAILEEVRNTRAPKKKGRKRRDKAANKVIFV